MQYASIIVLGTNKQQFFNNAYRTFWHERLNTCRSSYIKLKIVCQQYNLLVGKNLYMLIIF